MRGTSFLEDLVLKSKPDQMAAESFRSGWIVHLAAEENGGH